MTVTMKDVRKFLTQDEVDYAAARQLGPDALPFLLELVVGGDMNLASKAAYLAGLIPSVHALPVLTHALSHAESVVRAAAAATVRNLNEPEAAQLLDALQMETDGSVRKLIIQSAAHFKSQRMAAVVERLAATEAEPYLRELATKAAAAMR